MIKTAFSEFWSLDIGYYLIIGAWGFGA